jgi:hypothetical protein
MHHILLQCGRNYFKLAGLSLYIGHSTPPLILKPPVSPKMAQPKGMSSRSMWSLTTGDVGSESIRKFFQLLF